MMKLGDELEWCMEGIVQVDEASSKIETPMSVYRQALMARVHPTVVDSVIYLLSKSKKASKHILNRFWSWIMTCSYARLVPVQW